MKNRSRIAKALAAAGTTAALLATHGTALAVSSWNPTLLVNTESFQIIDEGNGTSNVYIQFGQTLNKTLTYNRTTSRFEFNDNLSVTGNIRATGSVSGSTLTVDGTSTFGGVATHNNNVKVRGNLSGSTLNVDGNSIIRGSLSTTGAISTNGNLTINSDLDSNNAVLSFGNNATTKTLQYNNSTSRFEFSTNVSVTGNLRTTGNLSGSTLTVDGNLTLRGVTYSGPTAQGGANTFLKNDGAGNLTWATTSVANGSGNIVSMHPEFPNATYFASGATAVGTMALSYDATNRQNYYEWTTTQSALQDYWTAVRLQIPKNFSHFETASGMVVRLRTTSTNTANNYISIRMLDTAGSLVSLTSNHVQASTSANTWRALSIGGVTSGTYTPGGYITLLIKTAAKTGNVTDLGSIDFNWANTTP